MELLWERIAKRDTYTIGKLSINGEFFCNTLEDTDRGLTQDMKPSEVIKVKDQNHDGCDTNDCITAIPTGTYKVNMKFKSPKYSNYDRYPWAKEFDGYIPRLIGVSGFAGILIHPGSYASHSAGCILVGENKIKGGLVNSKNTFIKLMRVLKGQDNVTITIK